MKNSTLKFILLISVLFNISILITMGYVYSKHIEYRTSGWKPNMERFNRFLVKELSLTPDQAKAIVEKRNILSNKITKDKQQIFQKRMELINALRADKPDMKVIHQDISEIRNMQEDIQNMIVAHILDEKTILNKAQQKKLFDLIQRVISNKADRRFRK
ncbi:MAG: periplasmic heavy metal sensor [Deltaproteobacteria bacterium]|nr:periplasmic heavy metal sensor [Deltaproteobacteria bacterium]MCL5792905.1 periplasmic heavy metal sensor [Deltaproteobacteria bacterium]